MSIRVTDPRTSFIVSASAGSGKTYNLVSRLLRLLLDSDTLLKILVLTFSRYAVSQLKEQAHSEILALATMPDEAIQKRLTDLGLEPTRQAVTRARLLYNQVYYQPFPLQIKTFHSFFHDLLNLVPNKLSFRLSGELTERPLLYHLQAINEMRSRGNQSLAWLSREYDETSVYKILAMGLDALPSALLAKKQSDTEFHNIPIEDIVVALARWARETPITKAKQQVLHVCDIGIKEMGAENIMDTVSNIMSTYRVKEEGLPDIITNGVAQYHENKLILINQHWKQSVEDFSKQYQTIKQKNSTFDYIDLELKSFELLNFNSDTMFILFKLYNRINHILVDEFQDTSPIQWNIFSSMAEQFIYADSSEALRSIFLVGDSKQMIYGFRGVLSAQQQLAFNKIENDWGATPVSLSTSYRSSTAVVDFINTVFHNSSSHLLKGFDCPLHSTNQSLVEQWGRVEVWERFSKEKNKSVAPAYQEALAVSKKIQSLITNCMSVGDRTVQYKDVLILRKNRNRSDLLEKALKEVGVPSISDSPINAFEVSLITDLISLMRWACNPKGANSELMTILTSPYLGIKMELQNYSWAVERGSTSLFEAIEKDFEDDEIKIYLKEIINACAKLPPHDFLSRTLESIQCSTQLEEDAANALLNCALDYRSGRYPSAKEFCNYLEFLQTHDRLTVQSKASEANAVQIMTIHAAKGLEAEIVFFMDMESADSTFRYEVEHDTDGLDIVSFNLSRRKKKHLEEANLNYVAISRARSLLICSSSANTMNKKPNWYTHIRDSIQNIQSSEIDGGWCYGDEYRYKEIESPQDNSHSAVVETHKTTSANYTVHPIQQHAYNHKNMEEGTILHKYIELLSRPNAVDESTFDIYSLPGNREVLHSCYSKAKSLLENPKFKWIFNNFDRAEKEYPISYMEDGKMLTYIIDRLVWYNASIHVIDFKKNVVARAYWKKMNQYVSITQKLFPDEHVVGGLISIENQDYHELS